jgi:hypothetical protein
MYVCETCRKQVRPKSKPEGIVFAVRLQRVDRFGGTEWLEGLGAFFHEGCFPQGSQVWRLKPMPENVGDGDS